MTSVFSLSVNDMPWMIRADFSDSAGWDAVVRGASGEGPDGDAQVDFVVVDDPAFEGLTPDRLMGFEPYKHGTYFIVDQFTMHHPEHPLLAVDVNVEPGRSFRLIPSEVEAFAVNMLIANMDFADFADGVDPDGTFRGFDPAPPPGPIPPVSPAQVDQSQDSANNPAGLISDVLSEADPDDPDSFIGQLIREGFWNPASWQRLEAGMREACRCYDGRAWVPRDLTAAFHSVLVRTPNLVALPGTIPMVPEALAARLERIEALAAWFFRGWTMKPLDGPLPGEHDPNVSHG